MLHWAGRLGSWDLGIAEELLGPRVMHLRYDPLKQGLADQPAYFTTDAFPLHTDVSYVTNPPGLMLMHCVAPDPGKGGLVRLASCDDALSWVAPEVANTLRQPVFRFLYPPACPSGSSEKLAILAHGQWRFKYASMKFDREFSKAIEVFYRALLDVSQTLFLRSGDLLIVDNHRMVHGRTAFGHHTNDQPGRHIMRCYVNPSD